MTIQEQKHGGVGARIMALRKAAGMSQQGLADALGVSRSAVAQWETDRAGQSFTRFNQLAKVFGVPKAYLLSGEIGTNMPDREQVLLSCFRECSPARQELLLNIARHMSGKEA